MSAQKTGYYDRTGKAIRDGDRLKAIFVQKILIGYVEKFDNDTWHLIAEFPWCPRLCALDDIEILEDES